MIGIGGTSGQSYNSKTILHGCALEVIVPPHLLEEILGIRGGLDTTGLKLTVGDVYHIAGPGILESSGRSIPEWEALRCSRGCLLGPGAYIVRYRETITVPRDMAALAFPRSSLLRMGATLYTAVWDPGYRGRGIGLLQVLNPHGIRLSLGAHIGQLIYIRLEEATAKPYRGAYQGEGLDH